MVREVAIRRSEGGSHLGVVREVAIRRSEGDSPLDMVREVAIRHGEKSCFTQGGEED